MLLLLLLLFCGGKALLLHRRRRRRPLPSVFGILYISFFCHAVMMMMMSRRRHHPMAFQTSQINSRIKEYPISAFRIHYTGSFFLDKCSCSK